LEAPVELDEPILAGAPARADHAPLRSISPRPGHDDAAEWAAAGVAEVGTALGTMHPPSCSVRSVRYGVDAARLALRFGEEAPGFSRAGVSLWVGRPGVNGGIDLGTPPAGLIVVARNAAGGYTAHLTGSASDGTAVVGEAPALELCVELAAVGAGA